MTVLDMTERELTAQVVELATLLGWSRYHTWRSKHSAAGFPDEALWKGNRLVFVELKTAKGKLSESQKQTLRGLSKTCADVYVVRPEDLEDLAHVLGSVSSGHWIRSRTALNMRLSAELG